MKQENRGLHFESLAGVLDEVHRLSGSGYTRKGNWDLAQICSHLADWALYPIDGYPAAPAPIRAVLALMRITSGKGQLKKVLQNRGFGKGSPTMKQSIASDTVEEQAQILRLTEALNRLEKYQGPFQASPLFGHLDQKTWIEINLIHAEHHLAYLVPN